MLQDLECPPSTINGETVLECLRTVEVPLNATRLNVRPLKNVAIRSVTFGLVSFGNTPAKISHQTVANPVLARTIAKYGRSMLGPGVCFTSVSLNAHYGSAMHVDASNDGPSYIIALGDFTGGELWAMDRGVLPCKNKVQVFNGLLPHCTLDFQGERYSMVFFCSHGHSEISPGERRRLRILRFRPRTPSMGPLRFDKFAFPTPHLEQRHVTGFPHVARDDIVRRASAALGAWRGDWPIGSDTAAACANRLKAGEWCPEDVCRGLRLGQARLRSSKIKADTEYETRCPAFLCGPVEGVVVFYERSRTAKSTVHAGKTNIGLFGVFYVDGRNEELELEELATSLEPLEQGASEEAPMSAPALARRQLGWPEPTAVAKSPAELATDRRAAAVLARRLEANRQILSTLKHGGDLLARASRLVVKLPNRESADDFAVRCCTRVPLVVTRCYGGADPDNLALFSAAVGLEETARPPRQITQLLALEARLAQLDFASAGAFGGVTLADLCLTDADRDARFEELGPLARPQPPKKIARALVCTYLAHVTTGENAARESPAALAALETVMPARKPTAVWVPYGLWLASRALTAGYAIVEADELTKCQSGPLNCHQRARVCDPLAELRSLKRDGAFPSVGLAALLVWQRVAGVGEWDLGRAAAGPRAVLLKALASPLVTPCKWPATAGRETTAGRKTTPGRETPTGRVTPEVDRKCGRDQSPSSAARLDSAARLERLRKRGKRTSPTARKVLIFADDSDTSSDSD